MIFMAIIIGLVAGLIDIAPMIFMKLEMGTNISTFVHYFALGLIVPFVSWEITPWLKRMIISIISAIPVMIIVYPQDRKAIIPMHAFSWILGAGIGFAGTKFIG